MATSVGLAGPGRKDGGRVTAGGGWEKVLQVWWARRARATGNVAALSALRRGARGAGAGSRKVLEGALDALLKRNLIDFIPQPQAKGANQISKYYKVMFEKFQIFEQVRLEELMKNPEFQINTSDYKHETFVWKTKEAAGKPASQTLAVPMSAQSTHNIDSINNRNNKENKNN